MNSFWNKEQLESIAAKYPTPFYLYDEQTILDRAKAVIEAFSWDGGHRQFFAVKATPNPEILRLLHLPGCGLVFSSAPELELAKMAGYCDEELLFCPNYPPEADMLAARGIQSILDGEYLVEQFEKYDLLNSPVGLRFNPGADYYVNNIKISSPGNLKFGLTVDKLIETAKKLRDMGAVSFGLFAYMGGNIMETDYYPGLARQLAELSKKVSAHSGLEAAYINLSGGLGVAYKPQEAEPDIHKLGQEIREIMTELYPQGGAPAIYTELSRYITAPAGVLVSRVIHKKKGLREFIGLDASAHNLMRPMMYDAYHHITIAGKENEPNDHLYDVVGSVPEGIDRFAQNRPLPNTKVGDLAVIHHCGAHGHSMGYNYAGKLRCPELLLDKGGGVKLIRRGETIDDYMATLVNLHINSEQ